MDVELLSPLINLT